MEEVREGEEKHVCARKKKVKCVLKKRTVQIRKLGDNMKLQSQKRGRKVYHEKISIKIWQNVC